MLPLPEHDRDRIAQWVADGISDIDRGLTPLQDLDVTIGEGSAPILRISNGGPRDTFVLEVDRSRILYRHAPDGSTDLASHIKTVALPLLHRIANDQPISGRFLTAGSAYQLTSLVPGDGRPNSQLAVTKLVSGLGQRPWEARHDRAAHLLEHLDLKWAVNTQIRNEATLLWFKLKCPANDGYRKIDTTVVVQSSPGELPSLMWAAAADLVHAAVWPTVLEFMLWLFTERG